MSTTASPWIGSSGHVDEGWASSPITQNGCIRILSQPGYPNAVPTAQVAARLAEATHHPSHEFWPDSLSLLQPDSLTWERILSSRQVTDAYLLSLAVRQGGCFVTLDRGIPLDAVPGASAEHLVVLA